MISTVCVVFGAGWLGIQVIWAAPGLHFSAVFPGTVLDSFGIILGVGAAPVMDLSSDELRSLSPRSGATRGVVRAKMLMQHVDGVARHQPKHHPMVV